MNILQVSAPKSGSFWLNNILQNIFLDKNLPITSYIREQAEYGQLSNLQLSFKGQAGTDMVDIQEDGFYYRVSSIFRKEIPNIEEYAGRATLAWTHSTYCNRTKEVLRLFDKKVCIVRDPRDRALSSAKFAFTPYMQIHYPTPHPSPEEFLNAEYERLLKQWVWFYGNYLLKKKALDLHFVFYENLLNNFDAEFDALLDYLEIELTADEKTKISEAVSFSSMKKDSPRHLQKGKSRKWVENLSSEEISKASEIAGPLMEIFGYPLSPEAEYTSLSVPEKIPEKELLEILKKIDWQNLY